MEDKDRRFSRGLEKRVRVVKMELWTWYDVHVIESVHELLRR